MDILDNFYVGNDNSVRLNNRVITVRHYTNQSMDDYTDKVYYVGVPAYKEWTEQLIPKHKLNELVSDEPLDTSEYAWMDGIKLRTDNYVKEIQEIVACGSREAYEASLPESRDAFEVETDYRLSMLELGI